MPCTPPNYLPPAQSEGPATHQDPDAKVHHQVYRRAHTDFQQWPRAPAPVRFESALGLGDLTTQPPGWGQRSFKDLDQLWNNST